MKKKIGIVCMVFLAITIIFSTGVALAESPGKTVGQRLLLYPSRDTTLPAGKPFHIQHGYFIWTGINEPLKNSFGLGKMVLEVDGVEQKPDYQEFGWTTYLEYEGRLGKKIYTFNFPDGMTGEHTFVRRYYMPCSYYLQFGPMECKNSAEMIEDTASMNIVHVTFVEE